MNMATQVVQKENLSTKLIGRWESACAKLAALAEEIPANNFDEHPAKGARSTGEVLRHVAFWNEYVADVARNQKPADGNELPRAGCATKTEVLAALRRTAAAATKALRASSRDLSPELTETLVSFLEHTSEHYGQLAVYARMNGVVPPASRG
jgi:uncharacterized damage-inducible protein DinB